MAIITISRGTFAGGERLADLLAKRLGYRTISRELLYKTVHQEYGVTAQQAEEMVEKSPIHLDCAVDAHQRRSIGRYRRQLFYVLQAALCRLIGDDNAAYHGQAGHFLLPGIPNVLRVRLIAPRNMRIEMAMKRENLSRSEAGQKIDRVDSERSRWTRSFFGVDWGNPEIFDMVLNLEKMSMEEAADAVAFAAGLATFKSTDASKRAMQNLSLSSRVMAHLLTNTDISDSDIEIEADGGTIKVLGLLGAGEMEQVRNLVSKIDGVKKLAPTA